VMFRYLHIHVLTFRRLAAFSFRFVLSFDLSGLQA
jgi:hypothetical protein